MEPRETGRQASTAHSALAKAALSGALEATRALEQACKQHRERDAKRRSLYLESVEDLARDLGDDLDALTRHTNASTSENPTSAALVSSALRAADLATLAACALQELPPKSPESQRAAAAAHAASGAARSLALEHRSLYAESGEEYADHDLRGASWRASLAARQTDESLQTDD